MADLVTVKAIEDRIEVYLSELSSYMNLRDELMARLEANKSYLENPRLKVIIYGKILSEAQRRELKRMFQMDYDLTSVYFSDEKGDIKKSQIVYERRAVNEREKKYLVKNNSIGLVSDAYFDAQSVFISHTVRSGQRVECEGDVVIIGDVNAGAEIVAGGSIAIFGTLRGLAHAGASGREDVCVAALYMEPKQIRVSGHVVITEDRREAAIGEIAEYKHGNVIIRPING